MLRLTSKDQRLAARYIPKNAHCVTLTEERAAYVYPGADKRVIVLCYRGSSSKAEMHCTYRDIDRATEAVAEWLDGVTRSIAFKAERAAKKAAEVNTLQVGEILYTSWGYDQTNIDFYVVTKRSGKRLWVRKVKQDGEATAWAQEDVWPAMPITPYGDETMRLAQGDGQNSYVNIDGHHASRAGGRTHHATSYA